LGVEAGLGEVSMTRSGFVLLALVVFGSMEKIASGQTGSPRQVPYAPIPIATRITAGESALIVNASPDPPHVVGPDEGVSLAAWTCGFADAVAVIEVVSRESTLTQRGDWIESVVTSTVVDVLKTPPPPIELSVGATLAFREDGGQVTIGGTTVTARVPWDTPTVTGKRYLVFLDGHTGSLRVSPQWTYEIDANDRLQRLTSRDVARDGVDDLAGRPAADVFVQLRTLVQSSQCQ
jgi:hypothetical protein